jgi:hypothetical protein
MKKKKKKRENFYLKLRAMSTGRWAVSGLTNVSYNHVSGLGWQVDWALAPERKKKVDWALLNSLWACCWVDRVKAARRRRPVAGTALACGLVAMPRV